MSQDVCVVALNSQYVHTNLAIRLIKNIDTTCSTIVLEHNINTPQDIVLEDIISKEPKCVVFSCYIWNISHCILLANSIKSLLPNTYIVLAGPEVAHTYMDILDDYPYIDIICFGIGEVTHPQLVNAVHTSDFSQVEGIAYRKNDKMIINRVNTKYKLDMQEFPYYDIEQMQDKILYFETSRGCPFNCTFCLSGNNEDIDLMSLSNVKKHFKEFFIHNVNLVKLIDRTFNYPAKRAIDIINILLELKAKYPDARTRFHCEINPLLINDEFKQILTKVPDDFLQFEIGIQSTNYETLKTIDRNIDTPKQLGNIRKLTNMGNLKVFVDLIAGLPYETYDIFTKSFNDVYHIAPSGIHLGFLKLLKGSKIRMNATKYGIIYEQHPPYKILASAHLSYKEICKLERIESIVDMYYNSGNFASTLKYVIDNAESPFSFYEQFAQMAEGYEYFTRPHKFTFYYDVLYDYLVSTNNMNEKILRQLLLHDWACHQKPRVYPRCVGNVITDKKKDISREFYRSSDNIKKYLSSYAEQSASTISRQCNIEIYDYDVTSISHMLKETIILYTYDGTIKHQIINSI